MTTPATPSPPLKAPFPAFGGKSRVAAEVERRLDGEFGSPSYDPCQNWIEPFAFSAAVTLRRRPGPIETINDRNHFVANFWRAVRRDPEAVAEHADWPVNECDLHARHAWLVASDEALERMDRVREDPEFFDAKIAGWWCWGACCWIGSGWCDETHRNSGTQTRPDLGGQMVTAGPTWDDEAKRPQYNADGLGNGIARNVDVKRPRASSTPNGWMPGVVGPADRQPGLGQNGWGVNAGGQRPHMTGAQGINANTTNDHRPQLADAYSRGRGVNGHDEFSACADRRAWVTAWMLRIADRLRAVRVCCGHWSRVCDSPSTMTRLGTTGVFLDPPYRTTITGADGATRANRTKHIYANDRHQDVNALCDEVQAWCLKWGAEKGVRVALCGLEGEYPEIEKLGGPERGGWDVFEWKSGGGYGNRNGKNVNAERERIWFSPGCKRPGRENKGLFEQS